MIDLESAKESLKDFYENGDPGNPDVAWLEGWICGYTDGDHEIENSDQIHDELFDYLDVLKCQ